MLFILLLLRSSCVSVFWFTTCLYRTASAILCNPWNFPSVQMLLCQICGDIDFHLLRFSFDFSSRYLVLKRISSHDVAKRLLTIVLRIILSSFSCLFVRMLEEPCSSIRSVHWVAHGGRNSTFRDHLSVFEQTPANQNRYPVVLWDSLARGRKPYTNRKAKGNHQLYRHSFVESCSSIYVSDLDLCIGCPT